MVVVLKNITAILTSKEGNLLDLSLTIIMTVVPLNLGKKADLFYLPFCYNVTLI